MRTRYLALLLALVCPLLLAGSPRMSGEGRYVLLAEVVNTGATAMTIYTENPGSYDVLYVELIDFAPTADTSGQHFVIQLTDSAGTAATGATDYNWVTDGRCTGAATTPGTDDTTWFQIIDNGRFISDAAGDVGYGAYRLFGLGASDTHGISGTTVWREDTGGAQPNAPCTAAVGGVHTGGIVGGVGGVKFWFREVAKAFTGRAIMWGLPK